MKNPKIEMVGPLFLDQRCFLLDVPVLGNIHGINILVN